MNQAPVEWYERKQSPQIPWQTVYVASDGKLHFPAEMATDYIVNALNKMMREKQSAYRTSALGVAVTDREHARFLMKVADDRELLRMEILAERPVVREMEAVVAQREEELREHA